MRKIKLANICCILGLLLTGCSSHTSLSERAVIKAIYLNQEQGEIQAVLAVMSCTPQANTADVQEKISLYTGSGNSIASAIFNAEQQQNKRPFYAQNRLLLLGPGTVKSGVSSYLSYFGAEEVSRTNLSVFIVPLAIDDFTACKDSMEMMIQEGERMADEPPNTGNQTTGIYEMQYTPTGQFFGYLPVLQLDAQSSAVAQVTQLMLFQNDKPNGIIQNTQMQLALLLSQKSNALTTHLLLEGIETTFKTQRLWIQRELVGKNADSQLEITLRGKIESVSQNGRVLQGEDLEHVLLQYNRYLQQSAEQLYKLGFYCGNDIFNDSWWFAQKDVKAMKEMKRQETFYNSRRISILVQIEKA